MLNRKLIYGSAAMLMMVCAQSLFAVVPCSELKTKIEDGMKAKGVQNLTLTIVPAADNAEGKVVGTCDGGTNKIVYTRGASSQPAVEKTATPPKTEKKPEAAKQ